MFTEGCDPKVGLQGGGGYDAGVPDVKHPVVDAHLRPEVQVLRDGHLQQPGPRKQLLQTCHARLHRSGLQQLRLDDLHQRVIDHPAIQQHIVLGVDRLRAVEQTDYVDLRVATSLPQPFLQVPLGPKRFWVIEWDLGLQILSRLEDDDLVRLFG